MCTTYVYIGDPRFRENRNHENFSNPLSVKIQSANSLSSYSMTMTANCCSSIVETGITSKAMVVSCIEVHSIPTEMLAPGASSLWACVLTGHMHANSLVRLGKEVSCSIK